ncbi:prolipoprotein diacylglyceryl transferase family protein [Hymenobacter convexus]|uniref:prolipoprotein diacylglyceryl transferase family protein n=1 Tax=Hymenobacter sp. CA1UV-4 TaxID=3063782 RepID=UPI002713AD59|nr:prolipoprotein diacylglyceryl transferase family protein [Hymenobacter sp. CA1UV-4]MDO7853367.1 prolipoprotein diacylglyceryl transferase [Hymenobacter sp. CA1UV-4]
MLIPYAPGHDSYTPFYLLATLTNVLLLLWEGWRRGFPLRSWLTLVAASSLALILGTKLITHPVGEWNSLLFTNAPTDTARSILGGGLAAALTVVALRRWLGLSWAVLDALALPLCAALAVQCVGCLLTGCCFGEPTSAAWGLTYAAGTLPWATQVQAGLLPATAAHSLPVVPTQVLALALCAAVGGVLLATRRRRWPVGSWLLLQTGLLLLGRFGLAFGRDAAGEPVAGDGHWVLGGRWLELQLWLLPLGVLALGLWAWRVRGGALTTSADAVASPSAPWPRLITVVGMLAITALLGPAALTLPEVLVVKALLLVVLVAEVGAALAPGANARTLRLAGLPLSLLLMGLIAISTAQAPAPEQTPPPGAGPTKTLTVTGGVLANQHDADQKILVNNSGCSGSQRLALQQQVSAVGGEMAVETASENNDFDQPTGKTNTWGGGLWVGQQRINAQPLPEPNGYNSITDRDTTFHRTLVDVHIYKQIHRENGWKSIDARFGLHMGQLGYFSYFGDGESKESAFLMPEFMLRMGKPEAFFGQADFCYGAENVLGGYTSRLGLGSGLGIRNGPQLLLGYAHSPHNPSPGMGFASALLRLPNRPGLTLEPYLATNFGRHNSFSLKLNYRLGR